MFTLYAEPDCIHGLMFYRSPWCVKRRVLVLTGTLSLGEANKRFCQSMTVMQSVVGDCSQRQRIHVLGSDLHVSRTSALTRALGCMTYWICLVPLT